MGCCRLVHLFASGAVGLFSALWFIYLVYTVVILWFIYLVYTPYTLAHTPGHIVQLSRLVLKITSLWFQGIQSTYISLENQWAGSP